MYFCQKYCVEMRFLYSILLCFAVWQLHAVPARRQFFKARMADGTFQTIRFCGDENRSFYLSEDGYIVEPDTSGAFYVKTQRRPEELPLLRTARAGGIGLPETAPIRPVGSPKIPVILVNFGDEKMTVADTEEEIGTYFDLFCNGTRDGKLYKGAGSYGSVRDYFVQQSDSIFQPEFVIIGPVTLSRPMAYYGQNSSTGVKDVNFKEFCSEALGLAMEKFPQIATEFDNDGNGTVDLAFFIYAGLPESDPGVTSDAIWPKELISPTSVDGVMISVMACCSELCKLSSGIRPSGVGAMCHEVSHSLGLPDQYDTNYKAIGMSYWSLMDSGNYCGNGFSPCGMTGYERDFLNWRPVRTLTESCTVRLRPLEAGGTACKIVNEANTNEYYIVENRAAAGWDQSQARLGHGMMVVHVDYNKSAWTSNRLNTDATHQRMTFIPANNMYVGPNNATSASELREAMSGQPYPGATGNIWLDDDSEPAASVFTGGFMGKPIRQIREMENGDIVFKFMPKGTLSVPSSLRTGTPEGTSLTLVWQEVPEAECYAVEVYGVSENDEITTELLFSADSLSTVSCQVEVGETESRKVACRVKAMADTYEDSEFSDCLLATLPATSISEVRAENQSGTVEVYNLQGIRVGTSREVLNNLPAGVYVLRTGNKVRKVTIH